MSIAYFILLPVWLSAAADWREDLRSYYLAEDKKVRQKLEARILADPDCSETSLLEAIERLQLWDSQPTGIKDIELRVGRAADAVKQAVVSIPKEYDPARAWPLVISLHGQGQSAASMMQMTRGILGDAAEKHVIVAPQNLGPLGFTEPSDVVDQPRQLLISLRKSFNIDSDRVFLMGYSIGAHSTWMAGVMHGECFAGIMPLATPLQLIGNDLLYDELAANLRNLDTLFVWGARDNLGQDGRPHPMGGNVEFSRRLAKAMGDACGRRFSGIELPDAGHGDVRPPPEHVMRWLTCKREAWPRQVHQRFRLPEQSRAAWVHAIGLMGSPLADAPSTVKLKPGEDQAVAQKRHLVAQLGLIEATVNEQTISLATRKTKEVVLLLSDELIDLRRPVTILRNKRRVFSGRINCIREVMLRETGESWDFARIPRARVVIPASGNKVTFGYSGNPK